MSEVCDVLVCPGCRGNLRRADAQLVCDACGASFGHVRGVPAFVPQPPAGMTFTAKKDRTAGPPWRQANNAFYDQFARTVAPTDVVLDLGAGHGYLRSSFKARYLATDVYPYDGLDFLCDLIDRSPLRPRAFDAILLNNVLEHLPEPQRVIAAVADALKPGGRVAIAVPFIIKLHQTPYDFLRYTHFMLQRVLVDAGFTTLTIDAVYTPAALHGVFFREMFEALSAGPAWRRPATRAARSLIWTTCRVINRLAAVPSFTVSRVGAGEPINPWVAGYHVEATKA
jgi:SAM-dependent methyltransferase